MVPDSDSCDDILFLPATTNEPTLRRFRPKPRPKTVKPTVAPKQNSSTLKPPCAVESKCLEKEPIIPAAEEYTNQRSSELIDLLVSNPIGDHIQPRSSNVSVVNAVPGGGESIGASSSTSPTLDASSSNFHGTRGLAHLTEEPVLLASQNEARDSESDAKLQADLNKSIPDQEATALHGVEYFDDALSHPSATSDGITSENCDVEDPNISQVYIDHSDDEYRGEDMPKQKRAIKKIEKNAENQRTVWRRKKASEDADATVQPPTTKKKFSHMTQRRRRQVNKNLLETPESEIDPRQLSMKDLIRLAEAKEQILNKGAATLKKSSASQCDTHPDKDSHFGEDEYSNHDGVDGNHDIQEKPPKLNHHSCMNRPQSGRWSKAETELFCQALHEFGPDFSIIQEIRFPNRTRDQLHLKYKNEERKHPLQVADAIVHQPKDIEHLRLAVQLLHARGRENANGNVSNVRRFA